MIVPSFIRWLVGVALNTHFQKKSVLEQARETFNYKTIDKLNEILKVQHLGVNEEDVVDDINDSPRV